VENLLYWAKCIEITGLLETRKISGYHDEPLRGNRINQRSIRLNRSYRAIYIVDENEKIVTIKVIEVNKHEY
jgi:proteic killer suppression protein